MKGDASMFELRVLGPVEVVDGGYVVDVGGARPLRLLTALAIAGRPLSLDELADRCFDDADRPDPAIPAIRMAVRRVRAALGDDYIATRSGGYQLESIGTDAGRFEELIRSGRASNDAVASASSFRKAVDLWRGAPFGELGDLEWLNGERVRLEELHLSALEHWYDAQLKMGALTELLPGLEGAVADNPLRDRLHRQLMLALYRSGRQAESLRVFQQYQAHLAEVGLVAPDETSALEQRIVQGDASLLVVDVEQRPLKGYRIVDRLGEGAFSVVYRGTQPSVGRDVAIKQIRAELANRPEFIRRFEAEAHMVARLEHPHIVPLIDYWREPGSAYLVMRLLRGGSLESSAIEERWPLDRTVSMVEQIGAALGAAHRSGIIHRDVKSANILLDEDGNAYLSDFGIALEAAESADPEAALSAGSPAYASPEQLRRERVGPSADVHGLAIAVYEALTGRLPFPDEPTQAALLQRQLHDPIPNVRNVRNDVPVAVDGVLQKATAKDPVDRYPAVAEFVEAFRDAVAGPTTAPSRFSATTIAAEERNPYKGLLAFDEADSADFAGRDRLVDQLAEVLERERVVGVVGPSGSGKSSVVRAGLLPALRNGRIVGSDEWFVVTILPGSRPFEELEAGLTRIAADQPVGLLDLLQDGERGIGRAIRRVLPERGQLLLVVDQFEEIFTLCQDEGVRRQFLDGLASALTEERSRLRVVLTLRADFYDRPLRYESIGRLLRDSTVPVLPLAADELERAIVDPAAKVGCEFEPGLVSEIVADVSDQPGALPMMQYALTELYEARISGLLTRDAYRKLGGVTGALARRAEELCADSEPEVQVALRRMFGRLVTLGEGTEDTRRRVLRSEVAVSDAAVAAIDTYGAARLLSFDKDPSSREPTVEISHEALIREWPRLGHWLEEDRDDLRISRHLGASAIEWNSAGRPESELYQGGRLEAAEQWVSDNPADIAPMEASFLKASTDRRVAEIDAERRTSRRLRRLLSAVAVVAVIALIAGTVAVRQQRRASEQAAVAQERSAEAEASALVADEKTILADEKTIEAQANLALAEERRIEANASRDVAAAERDSAEVRTLGSESARVTDTNRRLALLLASEAYRRAPSNETLGYLQQAVSSTDDFLGYLGTGTSYSEIAWISDSRFVALTGDSLEVWNADEMARETTASVSGADRVVVDGEWLVVAGDDLTLFNSADMSVLVTLPIEELPTALAISDLHSLIVARFLDGTTTAWDLSGRVMWTETLRTETVFSDYDYGPGILDELFFGFYSEAVISQADDLVFLPTGELLANSGAVLRTFDPKTGIVVGEDRVMLTQSVDFNRLLPPQPFMIVLGPSETLLVVANLRRSILEVNPNTGEELAKNHFRTDFQGGVVDVTTSGAVLVTDGTIRDLFDNELFDTQLSGVKALDLSPDALRYVVSSSEGLVMVSANGDQLAASAVPRLGGREVSATSSGDYLVSTEFSGPQTLYRRGSSGGYEPFDYLSLLEPGELTGGIWIREAKGIRLLFVGREVRTSEMINLDTKEVLPFTTHTSVVSEMSPDGHWIVVVSSRLLHVYDIAKGELVLERPHEAEGPSSASFTSDSSLLTVVTRDGTIQSLEAESWSELSRREATDITFLAYSPDGRIAVTSDPGGTITVRDPTTLDPIAPPLIGHQSQVGDLGRGFWFGDSDRLLLSSAADGARLWNLDDNVEIGNGFPSDGLVAAAGADGEPSLFTGSGDHVLIWQLETDRWPELACAAAGRNLTPGEWSQSALPDRPYEATCPQWEALDGQEDQ